MREYAYEFRGRIRLPWRDSRGMTGIEAAILLVAAVVVGTVSAVAILSAGLFAEQKAKESVIAGISGAGSGLEFRPPVIAQAITGDGGNVTQVTFALANAPGRSPADMTPGDTIIRYTDDNQSVIFAATGDFRFDATGLIRADSDNLIEPGEVYEITMTGFNSLTTPLRTGDTFTIEVITPQGAVLNIERTTPAALDSYNDLG